MQENNVSEIMLTPPEEFENEIQQTIYSALRECNMEFERVETDDGTSMEACIPVGEKLGNKVIKTVFLTNRQKNKFYLYVTDPDKPFSTKDFCSSLQIPRVSFAPEELMLSMLGTSHGAATLLSLVNDKDSNILLVMDRNIYEGEFICCTDGTNTGFVKLKMNALKETFLPKTKHEPVLI